MNENNDYTISYFLTYLSKKVDGDKTLSTILSSVAYNDLKEIKQTSIVEVDFSLKNDQIVKAKQTYQKDLFSKNFMTVSEAVIEVGGTITVSF